MTSTDRGMATSTRGYKKRLFAKWEDRAKELDDAFYDELVVILDEMLQRLQHHRELDDAFYDEWANFPLDDIKVGAAGKIVFYERLATLVASLDKNDCNTVGGFVAVGDGWF